MLFRNLSSIAVVTQLIFVTYFGVKTTQRSTDLVKHHTGSRGLQQREQSCFSGSLLTVVSAALWLYDTDTLAGIKSTSSARVRVRQTLH